MLALFTESNVASQFIEALKRWHESRCWPMGWGVAFHLCVQGLLKVQHRWVQAKSSYTCVIRKCVLHISGASDCATQPLCRAPPFRPPKGLCCELFLLREGRGRIVILFPFWFSSIVLDFLFPYSPSFEWNWAHMPAACLCNLCRKLHANAPRTLSVCAGYGYYLDNISKHKWITDLYADLYRQRQLVLFLERLVLTF